ncbi:NAD-dependent epimerase/dehydratase family protein [Occallatibacter savannae]|uniref:NAD-dependent epimerase/dehydratase family protein n=1 Tax=Occallatibacter savannae TaxID=1002691 RepID=UPI000D68A726|nr:NAD-dependent epimerase/dehydratase family protein [Occallatibacter savannae]
MARIVVIGGSGHVGTYLAPKLVDLGHRVVNVSRGAATPYRPHSAWKTVEQVLIDRKIEEAKGQFGARIADLHADIVVDMISFELEGTQQLVEALRGKIEHYLFCSSIWVYGSPVSVPTTELERPNAVDAYGLNKTKIEDWLLQQARRDGFPATAFRPGHIVGEGWVPINPQANANPKVFAAIARGEELTLPNLGLEMLHHVHADDVAQWIICAIENRTASIGEVFNTVSQQALTLRGYAEEMYRWFGHEPRLSFAPFDQWKLGLEKSDAESSWGHIVRSSCVSIEKSRQRLGYIPRFSSLEAIQQSVTALIVSGRIAVPHSAVDA